MTFFKNSIYNLLIILIITFFISFLLYIFSKPVSCFYDKKKAVYDNYNPVCTISGNYLPYQKWKSLDYSWCVTSDGIIIPGTYKRIEDNLDKNHNYFSNLRFNECFNIRNNLNINQKAIVLLGRIFNPYTS